MHASSHPLRPTRSCSIAAQFAHHPLRPLPTRVRHSTQPLSTQELLLLSLPTPLHPPFRPHIRLSSSRTSRPLGITYTPLYQNFSSASLSNSVYSYVASSLERLGHEASPRRRPRLTPLCGQYTPEPPLSHHRSAQHPPRLRPARSRHPTRLLNSELRLLWLPPRRPRAPSRSPHSPPPHPPKPSAGSHARPSAPCPRPKFIGASLSNSISSLAANTGPHAGRARKHLSGIRRVNERAC